MYNQQPANEDISATLHMNNRLVSSPFGLIGTNENALTFALGYTFQQHLPLLQWFLSQIGISGVKASSLTKVQIKLQKHNRDDDMTGIADVTIYLSGHFYVVIEAKIGLATPGKDQCMKYVKLLEKHPEGIQKKIVALVHAVNESDYVIHKLDAKLRDALVGFEWREFLHKCADIITNKKTTAESKFWVHAFYRFLDQEYPMNSLTPDVWILPAGTKPLWPGGKSFLTIHQENRIYFDTTQPKVRPLYITFRANGQVDAVYRVKKIEHNISLLALLPFISKIDEDWVNKLHTVWHLHEPTELLKPIRDGEKMVNRRVRCDFDLLLKCDSVRAIETEMSKRRENTPEKDS